jgi:hypothetical protein
VTSSLFVATVEHHTQAEAAALPDAAGLPYLGIWHMPEPEPVAVHVFGEVEPASLRLAGWTPDCARTEPHTCGAEPEERP